jgi:hypothetical protein
VRVQEVRWDRCGTKPACKQIFFYKKGNENHELGTGFLLYKRIRVEFVTDRMWYLILMGRLCDIIVLNVHVAREDKIDDMQDSVYDELERVFDKFPKKHMKKFC